MSVTTDSTTGTTIERSSSPSTDTIHVVHDRRSPWLAIGITAAVVGTLSVAGTWAALSARTTTPTQPAPMTASAPGGDRSFEDYGPGSTIYRSQVPTSHAGLGQAVENSYAHPTTVVTRPPSTTENLPDNLRRQVAPE